MDRGSAALSWARCWTHSAAMSGFLSTSLALEVARVRVVVSPFTLVVDVVMTGRWAGGEAMWAAGRRSTKVFRGLLAKATCADPTSIADSKSSMP